MKYLLLLILFSTSILYSQKLPTEKDIYKFVNFKKLDICDLDKESIDNGFKCEGIEGFFEYKSDFILLNTPDNIHIQGDSSLILSDTKYFSSKDIIYVKKQFELMNNFEWKVGKVNNAKLITRNEINKLRDEKRTIKIYDAKQKDSSYKFTEFIYPRITYFVYSMPVFNLKKNICIINISFYNRDSQGYGISLLYKKIKHKWVIKKIYSSWVS